MLGDGVRNRRKSQVMDSFKKASNAANLEQDHLKMTRIQKYLSYVDRVPFARRKKPDSWFIVGAEVLLLCLAAFGSYATYYYVDQLHMPITRLYAKMGVAKAQSLLSQHLLQNAENQEDLDEAIRWMKKAAQNGDPMSSYNLAVAHLKDHIGTDRLDDEKIMQMIEHAAEHGLAEAQKLRIQCKAKNECPKLSSRMPKLWKKEAN